MDRFPIFKSCCSSDTVVPAAEPACSGRQTSHEENLMKVKSTSKTTHWKPKLQAISEDCPMSDVDCGGDHRHISETDNKKRLVKAKTKTLATAAPPRPPPRHGKGSRKFSHKFTLPALSPTPFMF